jgi:hypothetical protein
MPHLNSYAYAHAAGISHPGGAPKAPTPAPSSNTQAKPSPSFKRHVLPKLGDAANPATKETATGEGEVDLFSGTPPGELWSARVLLMGGHESSLLHAETQRQFKHQLELPFLLRKRAKGELQLLGGAWEPQDGGHPDKDPGVLIRTAIRTVREQSGVSPPMLCSHAWCITKLCLLITTSKAFRHIQALFRGEDMVLSSVWFELRVGVQGLIFRGHVNGQGSWRYSFVVR